MAFLRIKKRKAADGSITRCAYLVRSGRYGAWSSGQEGQGERTEKVRQKVEKYLGAINEKQLPDPERLNAFWTGARRAMEEYLTECLVMMRRQRAEMIRGWESKLADSIPRPQVGTTKESSKEKEA